MSLSTREQLALDRIESGLAGSDPKLTALLASFTRLTSGERMPVWEELHRKARWTGRFFRRARRLLAAYADLDRGVALLWVLVTVGLMAAGVALSTSGTGNTSGGACVRSWAMGCAATAPAHASRTVVPEAG